MKENKIWQTLKQYQDKNYQELEREGIIINIGPALLRGGYDIRLLLDQLTYAVYHNKYQSAKVALELNVPYTDQCFRIKHDKLTFISNYETRMKMTIGANGYQIGERHYKPTRKYNAQTEEQRTAVKFVKQTQAQRLHTIMDEILSELNERL